MKKKVLIPIIVAAVIVVGGTFAYVYHSSSTVREDVYTLTGIGNKYDFNKITPDSKYNNFRNNLCSEIYSTTKPALPMGDLYSETAGEGLIQFMIDSQIQKLTGTGVEKDMRATVTIVGPGTKQGPHERMLVHEYNNDAPIYTLIKFWHSK